MKKTLLLIVFFAAIAGATAQNYYTVNVVQPPELVANAGANVSTCFYDSIQIGSITLATGGEPPYVFSWFPTYGLSDPTIPNPMALPDDTTTYTITVTDQNNCTSWSQVTVNIDPCAGIKDPTTAFQLNVYPNPSHTGVFNISLEGKRFNTTYTIKVYTLFGQLLMHTSIEAGDRIWSTAIEPEAGAGMYILEVRSLNNTQFRKIVIQ